MIPDPPLQSPNYLLQMKNSTALFNKRLSVVLADTDGWILDETVSSPEHGYFFRPVNTLEENHER